MNTMLFRTIEGKKRFILSADAAERLSWYALIVCLGAVVSFIINYLLLIGLWFFAREEVQHTPVLRWQLLLIAPVAFIISRLADRHLYYWHEYVESGIVIEKTMSSTPLSSPFNPTWRTSYYFRVLGKNRAGDVRETLMFARSPREYDEVRLGQVLHQRR